MAFGNASGADRERGVFLIKPSGIACDVVLPEDLVAVSIADGSVADGRLRPSSDTPTHLELYRRFPSIGGVVHTHSIEAARSPRPPGTSRASAPRMPITSPARCR